MHLGIPNWYALVHVYIYNETRLTAAIRHYAFTNVGLDPFSYQWFRFLSPERLAIDI